MCARCALARAARGVAQLPLVAPRARLCRLAQEAEQRDAQEMRQRCDGDAMEIRQRCDGNATDASMYEWSNHKNELQESHRAENLCIPHTHYGFNKS